MQEKLHKLLIITLFLLPKVLLAQEVPSTVVTTNQDVVDSSDNLISIREAIDYATSDSVVRIVTFNLPSSCSNVINLTEAIDLNGKTCTINGTNQGANGGRVKLVAGNNDCIFYITLHANLTLENIILTHGHRIRASGGAILSNNATLTARYCDFDTNYSGSNGGAISSRGVDTSLSILSLENCIFHRNSAISNTSLQYGGGAIYCNRTDAVIKACTFIGNDGDWGGAVKSELSTIEIDSCTFLNNSSTNRGGALEANTSFIVIKNTNFDSNQVSSVMSSLVNTLIGGAIYSKTGNLNIENCAFHHNTATKDGGAIFYATDSCSLRLTINRTYFTGNTSSTGNGGATYIEHNSQNTWGLIANSTFHSNQATLGGAVYTFAGNDTTATDIIVNCAFATNRASRSNGGGAIYGATLIELCNCLFIDNLATSANNDISSNADIKANHNIWGSVIGTFSDSSSNTFLQTLSPQFVTDLLGDPVSTEVNVSSVVHLVYSPIIGTFVANNGVLVSIDSVQHSSSFWNGHNWISNKNNQIVFPTQFDSIDEIGHRRGSINCAISIGTIQRIIDIFDTITICQGNSVQWHGHTLTDFGDYQDTSDHDVFDTILHLHLIVNEVSRSYLEDTACNNYLWHGSIYTESTNSAIDTFENMVGCDSIVTLHLVIHNSSYHTYHDTACERYTWHDTNYLSSGLYAFNYNNTENCPSTDSLHLTINHGTHIIFYDTAIDSYSWHDTILTTSSDYTYSYLNGANCPSSDTLHLTVNYSSHNIESATSCESYIWHDSTYTHSGQYIYSYINSQGAPSTDTLILVIKHSSHNIYYDTACERYAWHDTNYLSSGLYAFNYNNTENCPSTDSLHLTINHGTHSIYHDTACEKYTWHDTNYLSSGLYAFNYNNTENCPSTDSLHLTINHGTHSIYYDTACERYTWHDTNYLSSGLYAFNYNNTENCPSTDSLHLTINHGTHSIYHDTACEKYTWHDTNYLSSGLYAFNYNNTENCPSTDSLHLTINHGTHSIYYDTAIDNYSWHDTIITISGDYTYSYLNGVHCPSTDTLRLTVNYSSHNVDYVTACESYTWHGNRFIATGTYTFAYNNNQGIPSVDTLNLTINHDSRYRIDTAVCDSFYWETNGLFYHHSTTDSILLSNSQNCDSTITLSLTIHYSSCTNMSIQRCDSFYWNATDTLLRSGGYLQAHLHNIHGCDSLSILNLTIHHSDSAQLYDTVCQGTDYQFHGLTYNQDGIFVFDTTNINQCDSVIILNLSVVNPPKVAIQTDFSCTTQTYHLQAITDAPYLFWHTNINSNPSHVGETNLSVATDDSIVYWVTADLRETTFCPASDYVNIFPIEIPNAQINLSPKALDEQHLKLTATYTGSSGIWNHWYINGSYYSDNIHQITFLADINMDSVEILLISGNDFCQDTTRSCAYILRPHIFVPNIFMPNQHNPKLNTFRIIISPDVLSYEITIYDRAGQQIFHSTNSDAHWDGTHAGVPCPQGTYVYIIRYTTSLIPQSFQTKTGSVTLQR